MLRRCSVVAAACAALALVLGPATSSAATPKDQCSNLRGVQVKIPHGYKRGLGKRCVKAAGPKPDPTKLWAPKVETFYRDTLTSIQGIGTAAQDWVNGTAQPNEMQNAELALGQCEDNLARDTGVTPTTPAAQNAMTQLHSVCSLLTKAADEIQIGLSSIDASDVTAALTDIQSATSLLKSIVTSLGQPT